MLSNALYYNNTGVLTALFYSIPYVYPVQTPSVCEAVEIWCAVVCVGFFIKALEYGAVRNRAVDRLLSWYTKIGTAAAGCPFLTDIRLAAPFWNALDWSCINSETTTNTCGIKKRKKIREENNNTEGRDITEMVYSMSAVSERVQSIQPSTNGRTERRALGRILQ